MTSLPADLRALLERPAVCLISTIDPDGSPQLTQTWVGTDGEHILINTVEGFRKLQNVRRDPRVAVSILDPDQPRNYWSVKATVLSATTDGAAENIDELSHKYTGGPYRSWTGKPQTRVLLTIRVDKVIHPPR